MRVFAVTLVIIGLLAWFSSVPIATHLSKNRPAQPIAETGHVVEFNNHGKIAYITQRERFLYDYGTFAGLLLALLGGSIFARHQYRGGRA
ncbi:hypothetical protein K7B09_12665 [Thermomonas sp. RSS23]|uniref:Nickel/cobalt transporter regulator n=1 Tax=Thermomonas beijingensis TaxID=2872701 RepID=A0ABS7TH30_9GAMM|nr:hypothetical protein [Thermomonas beijingensis]MBZ4187173.1 hypothetical protein [Thermomonas beijingensis]